MKAFLMYPDRDFDPLQLLSRRERELRPRSSDQSLDLRQMLPPNEAALTQDLGLEILFNAMAGGDNFLFEVAKVAVLAGVADQQVILYRQRTLKDCLRHESVVQEMYQMAIEAIAEERKNYWGSFGRYPAGTLHHAVDVLQMFVGKLKRLRRIADEHAEKFQSDGFLRLFAVLKEELSDGYFAIIEDHLRRLKFRWGVLISAELGRGNKGANYVLRKPHHDSPQLVSSPSSKGARLHISTSSPRRGGGARLVRATGPRRQSRRQCARPIYRPHPEFLPNVAY
jgi:hypothetical protein